MTAWTSLSLAYSFTASIHWLLFDLTIFFASALVHFSSKSRSSGWSDKTDSVDATEFSVELPESELCPDCAIFEELLSEPDRSSVESLIFPVIAFKLVRNYEK